MPLALPAGDPDVKDEAFDAMIDDIVGGRGEA
jgi:hypothetical protein